MSGLLFRWNLCHEDTTTSLGKRQKLQVTITKNKSFMVRAQVCLAALGNSAAGPHKERQGQNYSRWVSASLLSFSTPQPSLCLSAAGPPRLPDMASQVTQSLSPDPTRLLETHSFFEF